MSLTFSSTTPVFRSKPSKNESQPFGSKEAAEEIEAYIAIRDAFLVEAEKNLSCQSLDRASRANELVESCLKPARSPYEAQCLPEPDAVRERKRCERVKNRIAALRARAA